MTARRLHAVCPRCNPSMSLSLRTVALRPDGRMVQHNTYSVGRGTRCSGSGAAPEPDAMRAWLAAYEGEAHGAVRRAQQALTRAEGDLAAAEQECADRAAWCAQQRGAL